MRKRLIRRRKEDDSSTGFEKCSRERERHGGCYTLREVGCFEFVVRISPIHLMFSWRTNFVLPLIGAVLPLNQLYMFCPRIRWILSTRAPSTVPHPFTALYVPYCVFIPATIYHT
jgi:hypothetical protein